MKSIFIIFVFLPIIATAQMPETLWAKCYGGTDHELSEAILMTSDGGSIVVGSSRSNNGDVGSNYGGTDVWVVKLDSGGNIDWEKNFGGSGIEEALAIDQTPDGGFIIAGYSSSNDGDLTVNFGYLDIWVFKIDMFGNLEWQKSYGGEEDEKAQSIKATSDGGYIIAGYTTSDNDAIENNGHSDFWILKLNASAVLLWQKNFGGTFPDEASDIIQTADGGYLTLGYTSSNNGDVTGNHGSYDLWLVKTNATGALEWQKTFGGTGAEYGKQIIETNDGNYTILGSATSTDGDLTGNNGLFDYWLLKINPEGNIIWQKNYGGSQNDRGIDLSQTDDNGFILTGYSNSSDGDLTGNFGSDDYWALKVDHTGSILWQKNFGGSQLDRSNGIAVDGEAVMLAGNSGSNNGQVSGNHGVNDFWVLKLNSQLSTHDFLTNDFRIYPNPTQNQLFIDSSENLEQVEIYSLSGKRIISLNEAEIESVNVSNLTKGIYLVKLKTVSGKIYTQKLIVE